MRQQAPDGILQEVEPWVSVQAVCVTHKHADHEKRKSHCHSCPSHIEPQGHGQVIALPEAVRGNRSRPAQDEPEHQAACGDSLSRPFHGLSITLSDTAGLREPMVSWYSPILLNVQLPL